MNPFLSWAAWPYTAVGIYRALDFLGSHAGLRKLSEAEIQLESNKVMSWLVFAFLPFQGAITYAAFNTPSIL